MALFPSGQFGGQELADDSDIVEFARSKGIVGPDGPNTFIFKKGDVIGPNACSTYKVM